MDATLVTAHSEKEHAAPTWKKTFGFHPIFAYLNHGHEGTGEPLAGLLRPGNAGANTAADHVEVTRLALTQLPKRRRQGRRTLIRTDAGGATHAFLNWLTRPGRALSYSIGFPIGGELRQAILAVRTGVDTGLQRRRAGPRRGVGGRDHRHDRSAGLAGGHARHRR